MSQALSYLDQAQAVRLTGSSFVLNSRCWVTSQITLWSTISRGLFFVPLVIYEIISVSVLVYSLRVLARGLHQSQSKRYAVRLAGCNRAYPHTDTPFRQRRFGLLLRMTCYTGLFAICWIAPMYIEITDVIFEYLPDKYHFVILGNIRTILRVLSDLGVMAQVTPSLLRAAGI